MHSALLPQQPDKPYAHGLPKSGDDNRLVAAIGYMPHTKSQWDASGAADKDNRLRLSDPMCEVCRLTPGD